MKNLFIFTILIYQKILSPMFKNILGARSFCRFSPPCSEYARISISRHGAKRGVLMSVLRLLECQPFYKSQI